MFSIGALVTFDNSLRASVTYLNKIKINFILYLNVDKHFLMHYVLTLKSNEDQLILFDNILLVFLIKSTIDYLLLDIYLIYN
jgi:hypothetical protein